MNKDSSPSVMEQLQALKEEWSLTPSQLEALLSVDEGLYELRLKEDLAGIYEHLTVPPGLEAAPALLSLKKNLDRRNLSPEDQVKWLTRPNPEFEGATPYELALSSPQHLAWVSYTVESSLMLTREAVEEDSKK